MSQSVNQSVGHQSVSQSGYTGSSSRRVTGTGKRQNTRGSWFRPQTKHVTQYSNDSSLAPLEDQQMRRKPKRGRERSQWRCDCPRRPATSKWLAVFCSRTGRSVEGDPRSGCRDQAISGESFSVEDHEASRRQNWTGSVDRRGKTVCVIDSSRSMFRGRCSECRQEIKRRKEWRFRAYFCLVGRLIEPDTSADVSVVMQHRLTASIQRR